MNRITQRSIDKLNQLHAVFCHKQPCFMQGTSDWISSTEDPKAVVCNTALQFDGFLRFRLHIYILRRVRTKQTVLTPICFLCHILQTLLQCYWGLFAVVYVSRVNFRQFSKCRYRSVNEENSFVAIIKSKVIQSTSSWLAFSTEQSLDKTRPLLLWW